MTVTSMITCDQFLTHSLTHSPADVWPPSVVDRLGRGLADAGAGPPAGGRRDSAGQDPQAAATPP